MIRTGFKIEEAAGFDLCEVERRAKASSLYVNSRPLYGSFGNIPKSELSKPSFQHSCM